MCKLLQGPCLCVCARYWWQTSIASFTIDGYPDISIDVVSRVEQQMTSFSIKRYRKPAAVQNVIEVRNDIYHPMFTEQRLWLCYDAVWLELTRAIQTVQTSTCIAHTHVQQHWSCFHVCELLPRDDEKPGKFCALYVTTIVSLTNSFSVVYFRLLYAN